MKWTKSVLFIFSIAMTAMACGWLLPIRGSGTEDSDIRSLRAFTELEIRSEFDNVEVRSGDEHQITITGDDNLLEHVETRVEGARLIVELDALVAPDLPLELILETPEIRLVNIRGTTDVNLRDVETDRLRINIAGTSSLSANGNVDRLEIDVTGQARIRARDLAAQHVDVDIAGSGNLEVCAIEELRVDITGTGEVGYTCNPDVISQEITGEGRLEEK